MHKILTGRAAGFEKLRQRGGLAGYPNRSESEHDVIETHTPQPRSPGQMELLVVS